MPQPGGTAGRSGAVGTEWDRLIAAAFFSIDRVDQPLWELVQEKAAVRHVLAGELALPSVLSHYRRAAKAQLAQPLATAVRAGVRRVSSRRFGIYGKPSALTLDDGRIYRKAFGLDPLVISRTLEELGRCARHGVLINTFMLASDYGLVDFVRKVTALCRGKAYFTASRTLGQYLLTDYLNGKTRTVH